MVKFCQNCHPICFADLPGQSSRAMMMILTWIFLFLLSACAAQPGTPTIISEDGEVTLSNGLTQMTFDLKGGTYDVFKQGESRPVIAQAAVRINEWASDSEDAEISWSKREVNDALGHGLALDLIIEQEGAPALLFSFVLYKGETFLSVTAGVENSGDTTLRVEEIYVLAQGRIYQDFGAYQDFAMIDGFSGGEPLEYGERSYSPLTRVNALKSRNNIFLTFTEENQRHQLVMGGLSYHDFEKFATIAQTRRDELSHGADGEASLLCYLDLPEERTDESGGGETLKLIKGEGRRVWENHEFRCSEIACSSRESEKIIIQVGQLKKERPYTLGFSWWQGHRHGDHAELTQSVYVEFENEGKTERLPLVENRVLPRFDKTSKENAEQIERPIPSKAIEAGEFTIHVEKAVGAAGESRDVFLSEIWLRDGRQAALLSRELTSVDESPRPRRSYTGELFAMDPVGKRVDPGQRYQALDQFYIDVSGSDPFTALERYARRVRIAQDFELSMYDFPTVCLWYAADKRYGGIGKEGAENTSLGAVDEARDIQESGFLNYSRAAVRLVPDSYMPNNQQGWWDDEHWQREDTDRDATQNGRYVEPYETTEKWGQAVSALGAIPLTYFQAGYRSEDYAEKFPGHMLFNKRYAWKGEPVNTDGEIFTTWQKTWTRNGRIVWGYDYTDPQFLAHLRRVYANLKQGGIQGLMFDYPASGWAKAGGMEDDYSTTAAAYRTIFRLPHKLLGPESYVHERNMERGSDMSVGVVASMRTENDTDSMDGATVTRCGLRWYKNRVLVNFDTDSKNLLELRGNRDHVRAVLTMCYVTSARLLLANSFAQFGPEILRDLTRTFPYHTTPKSARPVDAFVSDIPMVYDFEVNPEWHQVTFFNPDKENPKRVGIDLSGAQVDGALGLDPKRAYHLFDFWNNRYVGKMEGNERVDQELRPGEARMISFRAVLDRPQVLSTDRHIMQGYLDVSEVEWDAEGKVLKGCSRLVKNDLYRISLALNGYRALKATSNDDGIDPILLTGGAGIVDVGLLSSKNTVVTWEVLFDEVR